MQADTQKTGFCCMLSCVKNKWRELNRKTVVAEEGRRRRRRILYPSCFSRIFSVVCVGLKYTHHTVSTLGSCQHQARVRHVVPQIDVRPPAQDTASLVQGDVGLDGHGVGADHRPIGSTLALDFPTFGVPAVRTNHPVSFPRWNSSFFPAGAF